VLSDFPFDGNWVDCGAVLTGVAYVAWRAWQMRHATTRGLTCSSEFAFGVAVFPQCLLLVCVMSSAIIDGLAQSSRASLCVAGSYALGAMWDVRRSRRTRKRQR
jgi:hypothetical protein